MSVKIEEIITVTGNKQLNFQQKYPISENTIVELSGEFRSIGKGNSVLFFGLHCFGENGKDILSEDVYRTKESLLIISKNTDMKSLTLEKKPQTWHNTTEEYDQKNRKLIGIYYDGNINSLPDYLIRSPAYETFYCNEIVLNKEIPKEIYDKIEPYKTRVMNHYSSSTFDYSAASGIKVDCQWTKFSATYNGFSEGYGDINGKFRPSTKQISPLILANYQQNKDYIMEIKNIELIIKDKPKIV